MKKPDKTFLKEFTLKGHKFACYATSECKFRVELPDGEAVERDSFEELKQAIVPLLDRIEKEERPSVPCLYLRYGTTPQKATYVGKKKTDGVGYHAWKLIYMFNIGDKRELLSENNIEECVYLPDMNLAELRRHDDLIKKANSARDHFLKANKFDPRTVSSTKKNPRGTAKNLSAS